MEGKSRVIFTGISGVALILSLTGCLRKVLPFDIAWVAIIFCGIPIVYGAVEAMITEHDIKADVLVSMALLGALYIEQWFAAGEVAFIMQIGSILEDMTATRAEDGIRKLIKLTPHRAHVQRGKEQIDLPVEEVMVGEQIVVLAGETIPLDGVVLSGSTSVDQSVMTGESIPVDKTVGDFVISGTINQFAAFVMEVTKEEADSSLQKMIQLAKEAGEKKAPVVSTADRWATWMVLLVFVLAVLTQIVTHEFVRTVTVMVVFCPCAFILATPTAVMAGIGNATKYGVLIKSGDALERFAKIKHMAFDKTGTLTYGKPKVIDVESFGTNYTKEQILQMTAAAEQWSEHPLGKAICAAADEKNSDREMEYTVRQFEVLQGQGIRCEIDGRKIVIGNLKFLAEQKIMLNDEQKGVYEEYLKTGAMVSGVGIEGSLEGIIVLSDTLRDTAKKMIIQLKEEGVEPILLTGDHEEAAKCIGQQVGIERILANLLPEDKMKVILSYRNKDEDICMIGDGINDALALNTAYAGIAMGGIGSDIAVSSSDAVLVRDDIDKIPYILYIAKCSMKKIKFNIIFSMSLNMIAVLLAMTGLLNPVFGALVHNCGSVFVVLNSALLLRTKPLS